MRVKRPFMRRRLLGATDRLVDNLKQVHDIRQTRQRQRTTRGAGFDRSGRVGYDPHTRNGRGEPGSPGKRQGWPRTGGRVLPEYARSYRRLWERHWWWRSREAFVLRWIERLHDRSPRRRILDVGCGDGLFFEQLEQFGAVEGLEPDPSLIDDPRWRPR